METRHTSQLDEALRLQREGEKLCCERNFDEGLARFRQLLALLGKECPPERRAKAEMWIGWVAYSRGDHKVAGRKFALAARLLAPFKDSYPRDWIWLCTMNTTVDGRKASEAAAEALRGLLRRASEHAGTVAFWDRTDFSDDVSKRWVKDQNELAVLSLGALPGRNAVRRRARKLWSGGLGNFQLAGDTLYYSTWGSGEANPHVMMLRDWSRLPKCVLDPRECGQNTHLAGMSVSTRGKYLVLALSDGGSDVINLRIKDLHRNCFIKGTISDLHFFRIAWADHRSFYYVRDRQVLLHRIGTRTTNDTVVFTGPPGMYISPWLTHDSLFIIGYEHGTGNLVYFRRKANGTRWTTHRNVGGKDARLQWFKNSVLYCRSVAGSSFGMLIGYNINTRKTQVTLRPQRGWYLSNVIAMGRDEDRVTLFTRKTMRLALEVHRGGALSKRVKLPPLTQAQSSGRASDNSFFLTMSSPIAPPAVYEVSSNTLERKLRFPSEVDFDTNAYEQSLHWFTSFDGVRVPLQIVHRRGVPLADAPIKMTVYGGFQHSQIPADWDYNNAALLQLGCSLAFVGARGGEELGPDWHKCAMRGRKILPVRDTVHGAKYLHRLGIPASRIALEGGSNGGLIAAAALALSPESFGCVVITNPVIDVSTCTERYQSEYGHPKYHKSRIAEYSPLGLLKPASYPPVLVKVHANDDRVPPSNGFRFVAKLQSLQQSDAPILLRVYNGAGHSGWTSGSSSGEDSCVFILHCLGTKLR